MNADERSAKLAALRESIRAIPSDESRWKDAVIQLESLAPEGSVVPDLITLFRVSPRDLRWTAISLLGDTRHRDAWPTLARLFFDPSTSPDDRRWASRAVAKAGGDEGHAAILDWLRAPTHPEMLGAMLDALTSYGREEGALAIRATFEAGRISALVAAARIARMSIPTGTIAAWSLDDAPSVRELALEIAITRAAPTSERKPLPASLRAWAQSLLDEPQRPLSSFDRARLTDWIATATSA